MLKPYHERSLAILQSNVSIADKEVLELGAEPPYASARYMLDQGARTVLATNVRKDLSFDDDIPGLSIQFADAQRLLEHLPEKSADVVFATAFLEHVHDLDAMLDSVYNVLRPGGQALLAGAPIWSSASGHHLYAHTSKGLVRFYDHHSPIKAFEHLLKEPEELRELIQQRGDYTPKDVEAILHNVFTHPHTNRIDSRKILDSFETSRLSIDRIILARSGTRRRFRRFVRTLIGRPSQRMRRENAVQEKLGYDVDPTIHGITAILSRPAGS